MSVQDIKTYGYLPITEFGASYVDKRVMGKWVRKPLSNADVVRSACYYAIEAGLLDRWPDGWEQS